MTPEESSQDRLGQVQAATPPEIGLPYFAIRFLKRPQEDAERERAAQAEQAKVVKATVQERDQAKKAVSAAREDAAKLRGQVETLQMQFAELVRVLKPSTP